MTNIPIPCKFDRQRDRLEKKAVWRQKQKSFVFQAQILLANAFWREKKIWAFGLKWIRLSYSKVRREREKGDALDSRSAFIGNEYLFSIYSYLFVELFSDWSLRRTGRCENLILLHCSVSENRQSFDPILIDL